MTKNNNFIEEVEKEFIEFIGEPPETLYEFKDDICFLCGQPFNKSIQVEKLKKFISQKLQECQKLAYENERKIRRDEKCKTAEINYKAGREELKKEIVEMIEKYVGYLGFGNSSDDFNNMLKELISKIKNI